VLGVRNQESGARSQESRKRQPTEKASVMGARPSA